MKKIFIYTLTFVTGCLFTTQTFANPVKGKKVNPILSSVKSEDSLSKKSIFPPGDELPFKKIKWIDDEGGVDCITYKVISDKSKYYTGELVKLKIRLDYIDQLTINWRQKNCTNLSVKLVFPENFVQTGGTYFDFIPLVFSENEKFKEITIEGRFTSTLSNNPCFLLLKGPEFSNVETIFIKKLTKCFIVEDNQSSIASLAKRKITSNKTTFTNFANLSSVKKNSAIEEQFNLANNNNPIRLYTSNPEFCPTTENCDSVNICIGESKILYAQGCENGKVLWSTGDSTHQISVSPNTSIIYIADCIVNQIIESTDSAKVTVSSDLAINYPLSISGPDSVCANESFYLVPNGCPTNATYLFKIKTPYGISEESISSSESLLILPGYTFDGDYEVTFKCVEEGICGSLESPTKTIKIIQPLLIDSLYVPLIQTKVSSLSLLATLSDKYCIGETTTLVTEGCRGTIRWADNSIGNSLAVTFQNVTQNINYTCEFNGCERSGSLTIPAGVTKLNTPTLVFDYDTHTAVKAAEKTQATNLTLKAGQCEREYKWWDGTQTQINQRTIDVSSNTETTIYSVKCADPNGTCASDSATVGLYILSIETSRDSLCFGESAELVMNGCINGIVRWYGENELAYFGGGNPYELINENTINETFTFYGKCITPYITLGINTSINSQTTSIVKKAKINAPVISANKTIINYNESVTLSASGCTGGIIKWSNGKIGSSVVFPVVDIIDISSTCELNGCSSSNSNVIRLTPCAMYKPTMLLMPTTTFCTGGIAATLRFTSETPAGSNRRLIGKAADGRIIINQALPTAINYEKTFYLTETVDFQYFLENSYCTSLYSDPIHIIASGAPSPTLSSVSLVNVHSISYSNNFVTNTFEYCSSENQLIVASGCPSNQYDWFIFGIGTLSNHTNTLNTNTLPTNYSTGTVVCKNLGCVSTAIYFNLQPISKPSAPTVTPVLSNLCKGQSVQINKNLTTSETEWFKTGEILIGNSYISGAIFKSRIILTPDSSTNIYAKTVFRPSYRIGAHLCKSLPSNLASVKVSQGIPSKQTLLASSNQFCGSEQITIKSTNCDGTLNWQWTNTNGQSGTLTADSIKTSFTYPTTYTAKCTNTCGTSPVWSDPLTITKYIIASPLIYTSQQFIYPGTEATLFSSNCDGGTVQWSNGMIGSQIQVTTDSISTYTAQCQIGNCISNSSYPLTISTCSEYKPTLQIISENIICQGGNKQVVLKVPFTLNHSVEWKVEDTNGNTIFQFGRPVTYFADATESFNVPENSYFSVRIDICSQWSDKILITGNGVLRPTLSVLNHPFTTNGIDLNASVCSIGEDSLKLVAGNGTNGQYVWLETGAFDIQNQYSFTGNPSYIYMDGGNYGLYRPTVVGENDSLFTYNLRELGIDEVNERTIYVFTYKDGCLSYPTQVNFKQRPIPQKLQIVGNNIDSCPGAINYLTVSNQRPNYEIKWFNQSGDSVSMDLGVSPSQTTSYYAVQYADIPNCSSAPSDLFELEVLSIPDSINITASNTVTCGLDSILLSLPGCTGQIIWQQVGMAGTLGSNTLWVSPTVSTSYTALCEICGNYISADTVNIQIVTPAPPTISASNELVCNTATGRVPIQFTASGCIGGTVIWSDGTVGSTFEKLINESIIYSAACKIGSCLSENSNLIQVTVLDPPIPPILSASNAIKCLGDATPIILTAEACNGTLVWQGISGSASIIEVTPLVSTTYVATCTNECGSSSESITINVENKPETPIIVNLNGGSFSICTGGGEQFLLTVENCSGTVNWTAVDPEIGYLDESYYNLYPSTNTTIKAVCISEAGCASDTATVNLLVFEPAYPQILIDNDIFCFGDTVTLTASGCQSNIEWWREGSIFDTLGSAPQVSLVPGTYDYVQFQCKIANCQYGYEASIELMPYLGSDIISISASLDSICLGASSTLTASLCTTNFYWSTGDTTESITVTPLLSTTYTAYCASICDTTTSSITIVVNQAGVGPNLTAFPSNICQGEEVRFTVSGCSGNLVWLNEDVQQDLDGYYASPTINTTYSAICDNDGCISDTSEISIIVNPPLVPYLTIASDSSVCLGGNVLLEVNNCSGLISWSNGGSSIADSTGKGALVVQVNEINTFSAICKPLGCSIPDTTNTVTVNYLEAPTKPTVNYSSTQICKGEGFTAIATGCNGTTFWSNGSQGDTLTLSPSISNVYYAYCSNSCGISLASDFTLIEVINPALIAITSSDSIICTGDSATLSVNGCNGIVSWNTPEGNILDSTISVAPLLTATYQAVCVSNGCSSNIASYTLTVRRNSLKPTISTNTGETAVCGGSSISLTATGCLTGTLVWSDGQTNINPITVTPTRNRGGYSVQCLDICSNTVSDSIYIEVKRPIAPELSNDTLKLCYGENFTLNVTSACDLGVIAWNDELLFGETLNLTADFVGRKVYRARCFLGNCQSPLGKAATVIVAEKPTPSLVASSPVKEGEKLNITVSGNGKRLDVVEWSGPSGFNSTTDLVNKNVRIDPATLAHSGQYTIVATNGGVCIDSAKIDITVLDNNCGCTDCDALITVNSTVIPEKDFGKLNYITETSYLKEYQTIPVIGEGMQKVSYFDGMGRATQQIGVNAGGAAFNDQRKVDVVSFMEYDEFGRETKKYLPFAKSSNGGTLLTGNLWNQQKDYYATQPEKSADQNFAFAETLLEESPLNRVLKQSSPGQDTQLSTNHLTSVVYGTNNNDAITQPNGNKSLVALLLLNKVKQFDMVGHEAQIESQKLSYKLYAPNQLSAVVNINEDEQYSAQFTDKEGKVVTTRQYNRVETAANVFEDEVLETNYVYDLFGRLRFVIQPEATKVITGLALNSEITPFTATYKDFVFYYQYDKRGRMTRKRVPGMSEFVTMEYDERDLLIKSTDANGKITSTEYDVLKRPIRNYLQNNASETPLLITESFYDKYEGLNTAVSLHFDYVHASNTLSSIFDPIGLPTGTKTIVLNENNQARLVGGQPQYLISIIYYDDKKRPLQTVSENIFGKVERTSNKLDFSGRILESHSTTEYLEAGVPKTLETYAKNTYDQSSRLAAVCQKLDNDKWEPISRNSYSPLGELTMKKLGCDQQRVDFDYNIKGWLTNINKPNATASTFLVQKDLFAMKLNYAGNFTGNIMGQQWQTADRTDKNAVASTIQNYNYRYDELNRILKADFVGTNTNGISTTMYNPTQANQRAYDLNGNILGLYRNVNNQPVDVLSYNYTIGNRVESVTDASANTDIRYFTDLHKTGADYTYDAMGNMITDANKHLTGIAYNHQNLPTQIERTGTSASLSDPTGKMKYYYTGTGQKLMVEIFDGAATAANATKTRYYLGGLVMKGTKVEFINTTEGRAIPKASVWTNPNGTFVSPPGATSTWTYEYQLKDHLGNLRVACRCGDPKRNTNNGNIQANAAREPAKAVQTEDYDAWGLSFGSSIAPPPGAGGLNHRYLYNGKEQVQDLNIGLYEYGFRWYDAQTAKFVQVDPLADEYSYKSSYDYAENAPINAIDLDGLEKVSVIQGVGDRIPSLQSETESDHPSTINKQPNIIRPAQQNIPQLYQTKPASVFTERLKNYTDKQLSEQKKWQTLGENYPILKPITDIGIADNKADIQNAIEGFDYLRSVQTRASGTLAAWNTLALVAPYAKFTTAEGFLLGGMTLKTPINIPVQRFGNMNLDRADFWGLRIGTSTFANRTFGAIKPVWNPLTQYTKGVIPRGTSVKFGIIGPQGLKYPGGSLQFITPSNNVINQSSNLLLR